MHSDAIELPDGPFTLEAWVKPDRFKGRQGVIAKTEASEYGFFANDGELSFLVHLGGAYVQPKSGATRMRADEWQHIAGVFDGAEIRLYLDGRLVGRAAASGKRTRNALPLVVGGDVDGRGRCTASFDGLIDEVRLSRGALYEGPAFSPERRLGSGPETVLLLHMDATLGPFLRGGVTAGAMLRGAARVKSE